MLRELTNSSLITVLQKGLDAASLRHTVISNNIANANTPGYKKMDVSFEEELKAALAQSSALTGKTSSPRHIPIGSPSLEQVVPRNVAMNDTTMRNDRNNVDIDDEMAKLAKNNLMYNAISQTLNDQFRLLRSVIKEGRG